MGAGRLTVTLQGFRASQGTFRVLWQEEKLQERVQKNNKDGAESLIEKMKFSSVHIEA